MHPHRCAVLLALLAPGCTVAPPSHPAPAGLAVHRYPGDPPPLVVPQAAWLEADLDALVPERAKVFYDLRGRGASRPVRPDAVLTLEDDVRDLEALRGALGIERMDLLGWGYAGGLALTYARSHPERVRRLVLVSPLPPRRNPYWTEYLARLAERVAPEALAELEVWRTSGRKQADPASYARAYTRLSLATFCRDDTALERVHSTPFAHADPDRVASLTDGIVARLGDWSWDPTDLQAVRAPVLIVHGTDDLLPVEASREYARTLADARLTEIPDCGRLPWIEAPQRFFPAVNAFLRPEGGASDGAGDG